MRNRMIVVVGVALIVGGMTLGRSRGQTPEAPREADRAVARTRLAHLRAEVELLRLEHEVDVELLKALTNDVKTLGTIQGLEPDLLAGVDALKKSGQIPDAVEPPAIANLPGTADFLESRKQSEKVESLADKLTLDAGRAALDRARRDFLAKTTELNQRQLELEAAERKYADPR